MATEPPYELWLEKVLTRVEASGTVFSGLAVYRQYQAMACCVSPLANESLTEKLHHCARSAPDHAHVCTPRHPLSA